MKEKKEKKIKELEYAHLLRRRRELSTKLACSSGQEYKECLQELFDVKEEVERRKHL